MQIVKPAPSPDERPPFSLFEAYFYMLPLARSGTGDDQQAFASIVASLSRTCSAAEESFVRQGFDIAVRHQDVIERFGRFPQCNRVLGRASTDAEPDFLSQPGSRFLIAVILA